MCSRILYTARSIVALLVVLTIFFSIRPEGFLRRGETAVIQAEVEAAGATVSFTGKKAGADIPRVIGAEDFMAQYLFSEFTVEPVNAVPTGVYELALFDRGLAADLDKGKAVTLPICARAGVNTYAKPYLQDICAEYGADLENVVYTFDDGWYKEHSGQILLIRLGVTAGIIVVVAVLWAFVDGLLKQKSKAHH